MRTGKTEKQITEIKERLDNNKTVIIAGLKTPTDYLNRLGEGYVAEQKLEQIAKQLQKEDITSVVYALREVIKRMKE